MMIVRLNQTLTFGLEHFQCCFGDIGRFHGTWNIGRCVATGNMILVSIYYAQYFKMIKW